MYERNLFFSDYIPFEIIEKPQVSITFHLYEYRSKLGTPMIRWLLNIDMSICGPIPCRGTISDGEVITAREDQRGLQQLGTGSHRDETSDGFAERLPGCPAQNWRFHMVETTKQRMIDLHTIDFTATHRLESC